MPDLSPTDEQSPTAVLGVDCATKFNNVGAVAGVVSGGTLRCERLLNDSEADLADWITEKKNQGQRSLIALDAPLGWPKDLGTSLKPHRAGHLLEPGRNVIFCRETDRRIREELGVRPLEVGANLIARTAHRTLEILDELRKETGEPLPLAWEPSYSDPAACIEVYPAATLKAWGLRHKGYKGSGEEGRERRAEILDSLLSFVEIPSDIRERSIEKDDVLDAVVCLLAARDFLTGRSPPPKDQESAAVEGWIWVKAE